MKVKGYIYRGEHETWGECFRDYLCKGDNLHKTLGGAELASVCYLRDISRLPKKSGTLIDSFATIYKIEYGKHFVRTQKIKKVTL